MLPLTEPFPSIAPDLPGEVILEDDDSNTANWINHCIETNGISIESGPGLDIVFRSHSSCGFTANTELLSIEAIDEEAPTEVVEQPTQPPTPISVPASPASSDSSCHRSTSSMPRHKRPSHKRAELKRRDKIKNRLDDLKAEVPSIAFKERMSESAILSKAAEYAKHLKGDCERFSTEAGNLRQEIESLSTEIHMFQELLPAGGLTSETNEDPQKTMDQRLESYLTKRTKDNWKFYIFNFFMRRMFKSYKQEVTTDSLSSFESSLSNWVNEHLSLSNLRPQSLEVLKDVCKETEIMIHPENLPQQALASVGLTSINTHQPTVSSSPSPLQMPTVISRQLAVSPKTTVGASCHASSASCASKAAGYQHAQDYSPKLKSITPQDSGLTALTSQHSPVSSRTSSAALYKPARKSSPKLRSTSPKVSVAAAMKQEPFQLVVGSKLSTTNRVSNLVPVTLTQSLRQQRLSRISVGPQLLTVVPEATMSLPGHQPSTNIVLNQQAARNIPPTTSVSTAAHRPIRSTFSHVANITNLATSIGETSLTVSPAPAAVAPAAASPQPDTKVAKLSISGIAGSDDCHLYDFDIIDIPLPDLPESMLSSPQPSFTTSSPFTCLTTVETFPLTVGSPTASPAQPTSSFLTFSYPSLTSQPHIADLLS